MVDAGLVKHGGVQVVNGDCVLGHRAAEFLGFSPALFFLPAARARGS